MKVPALHMVCTDTAAPLQQKCWGVSLQVSEGRRRRSPLGLCWCGEAEAWFFLYETGVELVLSKSFLSCLNTYFLVLWIERGGVCWVFLLSASVGISELYALQLQVSDLWGQKNPGYLPPCLPWVLKSCLFSTFQNFLIFVVYFISRVFSVLGGSNSMSSPSSWKQK